jgi:arylsulfatase A-like enzyme
VDLLPTLLDAAGAWLGGKEPAGLLPEAWKIDGISLLDALAGKTDGWPDRSLVIQAHRGNRPVPFHHMAVIDQEWKLVRPTGFESEVDPAPKPFELYRIAEDPGETRKNPES